MHLVIMWKVLSSFGSNYVEILVHSIVIFLAEFIWGGCDVLVGGRMVDVLIKGPLRLNNQIYITDNMYICGPPILQPWF